MSETFPGMLIAKDDAELLLLPAWVSLNPVYVFSSRSWMCSRSSSGILRFDRLPLPSWIAPCGPSVTTRFRSRLNGRSLSPSRRASSELVIRPASAISIVCSLRISFIVNVIVSLSMG